MKLTVGTTWFMFHIQISRVYVSFLLQEVEKFRLLLATAHRLGSELRQTVTPLFG